MIGLNKIAQRLTATFTHKQTPAVPNLLESYETLPIHSQFAHFRLRLFYNTKRL